MPLCQAPPYLRNDVHGHHDAGVFDAGRVGVEPSAVAVEADGRTGPLAGEFGGDEVEKLLVVPEGVPVFAADDAVGGCFQLPDLFAFVAEASVGIAPGGFGRQSPVEVGIEFPLLQIVVGFDFYASEVAVPYVAGMLCHLFQIPSVGAGQFRLQVVARTVQVDERNAGAHLHGGGFSSGGEVEEEAYVAFPVYFADAVQNAGFGIGVSDTGVLFLVADTRIDPSAHGSEGPVELHDEVDGMILFGRITRAGTIVGGETFHFAVADLCDVCVLQLMGVFTGGEEVHQHAGLAASGREGVGLDGGAVGGRNFGMDVGVGQVYGVFADDSLFAGLVDA